MNHTKPNLWKRALLPGLLMALSAPSLASAQCTTDADCADGERCEAPVMLVACEQEPCPDPSADGGRCVSELSGEACQVDADCGDELVCLRLIMAECPEFDPDCSDSEMVEGFCGEEGSDAVLAATSGLAPETASSTDTTGDSAPPPTSSSSASSSSGCSVAAGGTGTVGWLAIAALLLRRRRR